MTAAGLALLLLCCSACATLSTAAHARLAAASAAAATASSQARRLCGQLPDVGALPASGLNSPDHPAHTQDLVSTLGVRYVTLYAHTQVRRGPDLQNATVLLHVWLRRVQPDPGTDNITPNQVPSVRGVLWVEDPEQLELGSFSHGAQPVLVQDYKPRFFLEDPAHPDPTMARIHDEVVDNPWINDAYHRPFSFRFDLRKNATAFPCFKFGEASRPHQKVAVCLPPSNHICEALAPYPAYTADAPALWASLGPVRYNAKRNEWQDAAERLGTQLYHYVDFYTRFGAGGVIFYADQLQRYHLARMPLLRAMLAAGQLRLVEWDLPQRSSEAAYVDKYKHVDYRLGIIVQPHWDLIIRMAHTLLGLSACGPNLLVLLGDMDEMLYPLRPGLKWLDAYKACLTKPGLQRKRSSYVSHLTGNTSPEPYVSLYGIRRIQVRTADPRNEHKLWVRSPANGSKEHPILQYCEMADDMFLPDKNIVRPALEVVSYSVHQGLPLHGEWRDVDPACIKLLHLDSFSRHRPPRNDTPDAKKRGRPMTYSRFDNWLPRLWTDGDQQGKEEEDAEDGWLSGGSFTRPLAELLWQLAGWLRVRH